VTNDEKKALRLMSIASTQLQAGENISALQQYENAAKFPVWFRPHALLGAAYAKGRLQMFDEAIEDLEQLLADKEIAPDGTVFRADVLRCLCEILAAKRIQPERVKDHLEEAQRIYKHERVLASFGTVKHLQALIEEDPNKAYSLIEEGALFSAQHIPGVAPFRTGLEPAKNLITGGSPELAFAGFGNGKS
jgi:tetratricopeptide (TPR) repeat protein